MQRIVRMGSVLLVIALAASVIAGCSSSISRKHTLVSPTPTLVVPKDPAPVTVVAGQATTLDLPGGADLIIPPGAMNPGSTVSATYQGSPGGNWIDIAPTYAPVELITKPANAIHGLLTLEFPVPVNQITPGVDPAVQFGISTYDPATKTWTPFDSTYDAARHMVVAQIPHFSWWNPFTWDWASIGAQVNQDVGQLVGKRASAPKCTSGPPAWVVSLPGADSEPAIAVRACAQAQGNILDVELVNNRPYGMVLQYGAPVKWGWHEAGSSAKDQTLNKLADALIGPNALYLPPLGSASVGIFPTSPTSLARFRIGPSVATLFVDFIDHVADYVLGKIPNVGSCASLLAGYVTDRSPGAIRDDIVSAGDCLLDSFKAEVASGALDNAKVSQLAATLSGLEKASIVGIFWDVYGIEWQLADLFVDSVLVGDNGGLGAGFSVLAHNTFTSPPTPTSVPQPQPPTPTPIPQPPTPTPIPPAPKTYSEQVWSSTGVNTFTNYHNASGLGPKLAHNQWVEVSCKVYDPTIPSVNPDGYWYRIASSPWNNAYYSPANTFYNGDPPGGPYTHATDWNVPNC